MIRLLVLFIPNVLPQILRVSVAPLLIMSCLIAVRIQQVQQQQQQLRRLLPLPLPLVNLNDRVPQILRVLI
jgi:hypothetical protein